MKKIAGILFGLFFIFSSYAQGGRDPFQSYSDPYSNTHSSPHSNAHSNPFLDPHSDPHSESKTQTQPQSRFYTSAPPKPVQRTNRWLATGILGTVKPVELDTALNGFTITNPAERNTIALEYLGNLGSPGRSKIFFDRQRKSDFFFFEPYEMYYTSPQEVHYYDTKMPYTKLGYFSGGPTGRPERIIGGVFAVNVNPEFNVGMYGDWINAYGAYPSQSTRHYNAGFFGSYMGKHHNLMANISFNGYDNYENGGLVNVETVTNPKATGNLDAQNMPVFFNDNVWSKLVNRNLFLNYKYHLGIEKDVPVTEDSVSKTFIPVTSFIYTLQSENSYKRYFERNINDGIRNFYRSYRLDDSLNVNRHRTIDSTRFSQQKHVLGISLNQEYNTLMNFGLTGYAIADIKNYTYLDGRNTQDPNEEDRRLGFRIHPEYGKETRYKIGVGATLAKYLGENLTYDFSGEYYFIDEKQTATSFRLDGNIQSNFRIGAQKVNLGAQGEYRRECPDFFEERYFSNHIKWDVELSHKSILSAKGILTLPSFTFYPSLGLSFSAGIKDLRKHVYWDTIAQPKQYEGNIEIVEFTLKQQVKLLWYLHWDNEVVYQKSTDERIVPLPDLTWYSDLYLQLKWFKVLTVQFGADMRYNTKYYAPRYLPATGVFYQQNEYDKYEVGNYPYVSVYANCQLKQARFYIQYNHLNKNWGSRDYLVLPGYALNPTFFKIGISAYFSN